ncbi:hypothetical protein BDZ85DRAFT_266183 [Elsinoe ampelina]|uniref:Uncharacterized protein n=1 Tax=Elsinoe ampelina TaxID=302913 RepID=A0A6A6G5J4_9PEZI|nr:hypothetical protein BDZ85DRAFT_266183 [Elsinoe ampelina]
MGYSRRAVRALSRSPRSWWKYFVKAVLSSLSSIPRFLRCSLPCFHAARAAELLYRVSLCLCSKLCRQLPCTSPPSESLSRWRISYPLPLRAAHLCVASHSSYVAATHNGGIPHQYV